MPDDKTITTTGIFGLMPSIGCYLLLEKTGRFYIAHMPATAHLYDGHHVSVTGQRHGPHILEITTIAPVPRR